MSSTLTELDIQSEDIVVLKGAPLFSIYKNCQKSGCVVTCMLQLTNVTTSKNYEPIARLPYRPIKNFISSHNGWGVSSTDGSVSRYALANNETVTLFVTYFTND